MGADLSLEKSGGPHGLKPAVHGNGELARRCMCWNLELNFVSVSAVVDLAGSRVRDRS